MRILLVGVLLGLVACGSGGEALLSGTVTGSYDGEAFTVDHGFAVLHDGEPLIGLSDSDVGCGTHDDNDPPGGHTGVFSVPSFTAGTYGNVLVQLVHYEGGDFESVGSNSATVVLTAVTETSVSGTVSWSYTDGEGRVFNLTGTFEVVRCE